MILGISRASSGSGTLLRRDIANAADCAEARRHVAYVGEDKQTYAYMTVGQMIAFIGRAEHLSALPDGESIAVALTLQKIYLSANWIWRISVDVVVILANVAGGVSVFVFQEPMLGLPHCG